MDKNDFVNQFNDSKSLLRVYCYNEKGEKVWLDCNEKSQLTIELSDHKEYNLMLQTIRYRTGKIEAIEYNVWWPSKKISSFNIENVISFKIIKLAEIFPENEVPYFDISNIKKNIKTKNDSLKAKCLTDSNFFISLKNKNEINHDLIIIENASYNIKFRDNNKTEYGVVQKISNDSIYISNDFNENMSLANKRKYEIYKYSINDISELELLKSGGLSFKNIKIEEFIINVEKTNSDSPYCPYWYAMNPRNGVINFYRSWLTNRGFVGITEDNQKIFWYEGE